MSDNNIKKSNAIRDAADFTVKASYIMYRDMKAKVNNPNSHYNPETDTEEPGA
jgi:hypothetical protein